MSYEKDRCSVTFKVAVKDLTVEQILGLLREDPTRFQDDDDILRKELQYRVINQRLQPDISLQRAVDEIARALEIMDWERRNMAVPSGKYPRIALRRKERASKQPNEAA